MKRFLSTVLALSLLSGTAAVAGPYGHGPRDGYRHGYVRGYGHGYRHHDDGAGTAVAVGFGLLALTAIIAASDNDRERDRAYRQEYVPPPPPPPGYYGPDNGQPYGQTYQPGYSQDDDDNGPGYGPQGPYGGGPQQ
jgi:hypothetical protein